MSSGRTNAVSGGGAEPEFFALTRDVLIRAGSTITITAPKAIKVLCGLGLMYRNTSGSYINCAYPCSTAVGGAIVLVYNGNGWNGSNVSISGNQIIFNVSGVLDTLLGGYCCYIPE